MRRHVAGRGSVAYRIECCPQIKEEYRGNATGGQATPFLSLSSPGTGQFNVGSNEPHAERTTSSADHEQHAATEVINEPEEPEYSDDGLDNTEDAGCEKTGGSTSDANRLEDGRTRYGQCGPVRCACP